MKTNSQPVMIRKKIYDIVYIGGKEKRHEVKTTQYYLPDLDYKKIIKVLKILLYILLFLAAFCFTDKIKEVAPIMTAVLEQLQ